MFKKREAQINNKVLILQFNLVKKKKRKKKQHNEY